MAADTINGISGYITRVRGTSTKFIRTSVINSGDVANFDAAKTAGAAVAGTQTVVFSTTVVGTDDAGLVTGTYTATINLDGTDNAISIGVTTADDYDTVVTAINADMTGTPLSISAGNLLVTSPTTGNASSVVITDIDIFSGMTGYASISSPVDGGTGEALKAQTLTNGVDAWTVYSTSRETYDTAADTNVITTDYTAADLNSSFSDVEVETELTAIGTKVNSLQNLVDKINKRS